MLRYVGRRPRPKTKGKEGRKTNVKPKCQMCGRKDHILPSQLCRACYLTRFDTDSLARKLKLPVAK